MSETVLPSDMSKTETTKTKKGGKKTTSKQLEETIIEQVPKIEKIIDENVDKKKVSKKVSKVSEKNEKQGEQGEQEKQEPKKQDLKEVKKDLKEVKKPDEVINQINVEEKNNSQEEHNQIKEIIESKEEITESYVSDDEEYFSEDDDDLSSLNDSEKKSKRGRKPKQKDELEDGDKEIKKRGRKPKQKDESEEKVPKKRGRKPKEKVYSVKELPKSFYEENKNETLILHLPIKLNDKILQEEPVPNKSSQNFYSIDETFVEEEPKSSSLLATQVNFLEKNVAVFDMKIKTFSIQEDEDLINEKIVFTKSDKCDLTIKDTDLEENLGTDSKNKYFTDKDDFKINKVLKKNLKNIMYEFIHSNSEKVWPESTNIHCYWCCHSFGNTPTCLPEYFKKGKFYVSGCFCSFNCAASYNFSKNDEDIWERYSLLNLMYKKMYNQNFIRIPLAPPREVLKTFGGYLSIDEYRENLMKMDKMFNVIKPPLVAIIPKIEENILSVKNQKAGPPIINQTILNKTQSQLKLKRSKPVTNPNNTLQSFMDLKIIS